jgi:hypothetical protein
MSIRLALLVLVVALAPRARADAPRDAMAAPFAAMEKALRAPDETLFKAQWHPEGYVRNLVGGSGLAGENVFRQGSRKQWYPKPDFAKATVRPDGALAIVPCKITSWKTNESVDAVDVVLVQVKGAYVVLGGGEKRSEVDALAQRWLDKKPLAPK